jgi:glycosyltransferase involved in cell wall biosynthesis
MKIAIVTPIPTPYRDAFWNVMASLPDVELHVLYCATGKSDRPWKNTWEMHYHHFFMKGWNLTSWKSSEDSQYFNPGVISQLNRMRPEAILIGGYNHLTMFLAMLWAIRNGTAFYMMCETYLFNKKKGLGAFLKKILLNSIGNRSAGGFPTGKAAAIYLEAHGWKTENMSYLPNVPDIDHISSKIVSLQSKKASLKSKWKINEEKIILYVGRLVKKKNVDLLLKAVAQLEIKPKPTLIILGDGDERSNLKALSKQLGIDHMTRFLGFQEPDAILEWFALAEIFVLPSNETWGVAPIEAASAGLPLILSDGVGSACELRSHYKEMQIIKPGNIQNWISSLSETLVSNKNCTKKLHQNFDQKPLLTHWNYSTLAKKTVSFLLSKRSTIID